MLIGRGGSYNLRIRLWAAEGVSVSSINVSLLYRFEVGDKHWMFSIACTKNIDLIPVLTVVGLTRIAAPSMYSFLCLCWERLMPNGRSGETRLR